MDTMKDGHFTTHYPNGQIKIVGTYVNGKKEGYFEEFYENGELKSQSYYLEDNLNRFIEKYNENGISISIEKYELGIKLIRD